MLLVWDENAWEDYLWGQAQDPKVLKRINVLLADIGRNGNEGIGKPEALKHSLTGYWSRRITDEHRLVYKLMDGEILVPCHRVVRSDGTSGAYRGGAEAKQWLLAMESAAATPADRHTGP